MFTGMISFGSSTVLLQKHHYYTYLMHLLLDILRLREAQRNLFEATQLVMESLAF